MIIDIIFAVLMVMAIFQGFQRGLIVALFSILGLIVGLAAALKLSAVVAGWLAQSTNIHIKWLPVAAFIIIFFLVVFVVRWAAKLIEKAVEFAFLGWINKVAGVLLYILLYTLIYSVLLFFAAQLKLFTLQTIEESRTYVHIQPWGPKVLDAIGTVIPIFSNVFDELQKFFEKLGGKLSA